MTKASVMCGGKKGEKGRRFVLPPSRNAALWVAFLCAALLITI